MSGVYIKTEIPDNCSECFAREISGAGAGVSFCRIVGGALSFDYDKKRMNFCPLIPVPDHGDLIDVGAVDLSGGPYEYQEWADWALQKYLDAPTVIPADREGET